MNERRNPTLYADNRFFSSSFQGFFPEGMTVSAAALGRLALNPHYAQTPSKREMA